MTDEQLPEKNPPGWQKPAVPFRDCACGGRVRVTGVEMATRSKQQPRVHFRCTGCGTRWVEQPDRADDDTGTGGVT